MRWINNLMFRLRALFRPGAMERELDEEVGFHLEMESRKLSAEGRSPDDAGREARRRFGGVTYQKERARASWGVTAVREALSDVRVTLRGFVLRPGYAVLGVTTLGLGIGATVALFSVVQGLLLRPLPVADEDRLHVFWSDYNWRGVEFDYLKERVQAFSGLAAYSSDATTFRTDAGSSLLRVAVVSAELFDLLGTAPLMGRTFAAGEDRPGAERVAVVSWGMWRNELGGDPNVIGRRILLDGTPTTVIGVMPRRFFFPTPDDRAWVPLDLDPSTRSYQGNGWLVLLGRTRPGTSAAQLDQEVQALAGALGERFTYSAAWDKTKGAFVTPLHQYLFGDVRPALILLLGSVAVLLLIACANTAALVLARTTDRTGEIALRMALGAGRGRLARQIVTESLTLALLAGAVGAGLAFGLFDLMVARLPLDDGLDQALSMEWGTFAAGFGLAVVVGLAVAALPVRHLLMGRLGGVSGERGSSGMRRGPGRAHGVLVATEVTLGVLLVTGATLLIRSVNRLFAVDLGFDPHGVAVVDLMTSSEEMNEEQRRLAFQAVVDRVAALPGVVSAGLTNRLPVRDGGWQGTVRIESRPDLAPPRSPNAMFRTATPGYFRAMGMRLLSGRGVESSDQAGGFRSVVVSESFARAMWPDRDPLGQRIRSGFRGDTAWLNVVGVLKEIRMFRLVGENTFSYYLPRDQTSADVGQVLVIRTSGRPSGVIPTVRAVAREVDPRIALAREGTLETVVRGAMAEPLRLRFFLSLFAGLALVLGAVGVYGVVSYSVTRRRAEFGIRMALGAAPGRVLREVVRGGMLPVMIGVVGGIGGSIALSRLLGSFLYEVAPTDPVSIAASAVCLLSAGWLATLLPGWRAGRVDPVTALRAE